MEKITLNPIEQKYLASCTPLPERLGIKECNIWKENLRRDYNGENQRYLIEELKLPFPEIAKLYLKGAFNEISIQEYFESSKEDLHNMEMYRFAQRLMLNLEKKEDVMEEGVHAILESIAYANVCGVKLANLKEGKIWSYGINYQAQIDINHFKLNPKSEYVFVHGKGNEGHLAIREAKPEEVEKYMDWYRKLEQEKDNPFIRHQDKLEDILSKF